MKVLDFFGDYLVIPPHFPLLTPHFPSPDSKDRDMKRGYDDGNILAPRVNHKDDTHEDTQNDTQENTRVHKDPHPRKDIPVNEPGWFIEVDKLTKDQLSRYEAWKKSVFSPEYISDMISPYTSVEFNDMHVSMVSSCAKMFVGDLVEEVRMHRGDTGDPITPGDIEYAFCRLFYKKKLPPPPPRLRKKQRSMFLKPSDQWSFCLGI